MLKFARRIAVPTGVAGTALGAYLLYDNFRSNSRYVAPHVTYLPPPVPASRTRAEMIKNLKEVEYDVVVVGGGATGTGVAWDAATRGLKVALLERDDFSSATSSRSTKLVHGGVRYLEKAFWNLDYDQYMLVKEALAERKRFIDMAPHMAYPLPIMIPIYKWWQLPYFYVGTKMYDAVAGKANLESSYLLTRSRALQQFPMLDDNQLKGALVYYDGMHNDSRTNVSLAVTAINHGADVLNHMDVTKLLKDENGKICGVEAVDREPLDKITSPIRIKAKSVVNATGPFTDHLRQLDDPEAHEIAIGSAGVHIVLPGWYCPPKLGLLDPATSDGRVIFFLPWQGSTIAGTTDRPGKIESNPVPQAEDVEFVLNEVRRYIGGNMEISANDVRAAWAGIRPLVKDPNSKNTSDIVRNHVIHVSNSGLVTIAGGKWTTFREMAEETVDRCVREFNLTPKLPCQTSRGQKIVGADHWTPLTYVDLIREYGIEPTSARHLSENYGTRAFEVARLCAPSSVASDGTVVQRNERLSPLYPFLDGEVIYGVRHEYALSAVDVLARRTRLAFLDAEAAKEALPKVIDLMAKELKWSSSRQKQETKDAIKYLDAMGLKAASGVS